MCGRLNVDKEFDAKEKDMKNKTKNTMNEVNGTKGEALRTPTPWFIGQNNPLFQKDILDMKGNLIARVASSAEDAEFVIRAVNEYEHLIEDRRILREKSTREFQRLAKATEDKEALLEAAKMAYAYIGNLTGDSGSSRLY